MEKDQSHSKPLDSVKLETLGHIPSSFTSFKKDAASMHCSTVRPRPSQMSRYSCNFESWHSPLPQMTQSTVLPCHQNWPLNGTGTSSDFWLFRLSSETKVYKHTQAYSLQSKRSRNWFRVKDTFVQQSKGGMLAACLFLLFMFYVSLSFCLSFFLNASILLMY